MLHNDLMLTDFIKLEVLEQLQERISKAADVSTIILDQFGNPIMELTNAKKICRVLGDIDRPDGICWKMKNILCHVAGETRKPAAMTCPDLGMTFISVPIFLGDAFLGSWMIGRVRYHDDPAEPIEQAICKTGVNSDTAQKLLKRSFSRREFNMIVDFTSMLTGDIVKLASNNIAIMKKNERLSNLSLELNRMTYYDMVLQIPNAERIDKDMRENHNHEYLVAMAFKDFHKINNVLGRAYGEALLKAARDYILEMNIPDSTLYCGRVSDFCILFEKRNEDPDLPLRVAEEIHNRCNKVWDILVGEQQDQIYAMAHVCVFPLNGYDENLSSYLPSAMEYSMEIARNAECVVIYDDDTRKRFNAKLQLEINLKNAVREDMRGFSVHYQPVVDIKTAMWKGIEALCRWDSPEYGNVSPEIFIPIAEGNGLIGTIGLWVMEQSVIQVKAWGLDRIEGFLLEVNLSPVQLTIPNLDQRIMELLEKYDYPPEKFGLEVTESNKINFSNHTMESIERLNKLGVIIVLDDFGTGYSSFNSLHKMPVKVLKTDKTLIAGIESDSYLRKLLGVMVSLAHDSGMELVAEGVENNLQLQYLLKLGVDFIQGFFFSHPLTMEQLSEKLDNFHYPNKNLLSHEIRPAVV